MAISMWCAPGGPSWRTKQHPAMVKMFQLLHCAYCYMWPAVHVHQRSSINHCRGGSSKDRTWHRISLIADEVCGKAKQRNANLLADWHLAVH